MKTKLFIIVLLVLTKLANAQFTKLYEFPGSNDLKQPYYSQPVFDGTWIYAMTYGGGTKDFGTIFKVKPDGTGFTKMLDFTGTNGKWPWGSLTLYGGVLYGMTREGGTNSEGVIFKINTDGTGFSVIRNMAYGEANLPYGSLILSNGKLFGMSYSYVGVNAGCIFTIKTDGTCYKILHGFAQADGYPRGDLEIVGGVLFGMVNAHPNPTISKGCIFKIDTSGNNYKVLHSFTGVTTDGSSPRGSLEYVNKKLYGMTCYGGSSNQGCIFTIDTAGTNYKHLLNFNGTNGAYPTGSLVLGDSVLYGMTYAGGNSQGVIFRIDTTGNNYNKMLDFKPDVTGATPYGSLFLSGDLLYGMTAYGGSGGQGNLFKIKTSGLNFTQIFDCSGSYNGKSMYGALTYYNNAFYGMTQRGGTKNLGCIFKINPDGTGYNRIMDFDSINGALPYGDLILVGDFFYGMTSEGGATNKGCIFKIKPDGTGYHRIADFDGTNHGANPYGSLVAIGNDLYGMTYAGGTGTIGCIFTIKTDGTGFTKLIDFNGTEKGGRPYGSLAVSNSVLYGMTSMGGSNNYGNLFKLNSNGTGFSTIVNFSGTSVPYGSSTMYTTPVIIGNSLYGMTYSGATSNQGCIFKIDLSTNTYWNVANFNASGNGSHPYGSPIIYGKSLYGLTRDGGTNSVGCIFKRDTLGLFNSKIYSFKDTSGTSPYGTFINYNNELYGSTSSGGISGLGTLFKYTLTPDSQANTISCADTTIHWTKGNGMKRVVFLKQGTGTISNPVDKASYTASSNWTSKGTQLGSTGYYCVYNGSGNSVAITGLSPLTSYTVRIYEYNGSSENEQYFDSTALGNPLSFTTPKFTPVITWTNPADISYGTLLSATQLNAYANVAGTYVYNPAAGTKLNVGNNQSLQVNFTPTNGTNYNTASKTVSINVTKGIPVITWSNPADIIYGTLLGNTQLNATADVAGTFVYTPASGTKLNAGGSQSLKVDFTPTDAANYNTVSKTVAINVSKVTPVITWSNPSDITYGTLLDNTQLNATADVTGTIVYTPASGTKLDAGSNQSLQSDFTPTDVINYNTTSKTVTINVAKVTPVITWTNPADIIYGTLLSEVQLNATADVTGTFIYTPASGTKLSVGNNQSLTTEFTPTDVANYNTVSKTVNINVLEATGLTWQKNENGIKIYPNPASDILIVQSEQLISEICIIDCLGTEKLRERVNNTYKELPLTGLPKGIWLVKVTSGAETGIYKIIKE
jgi:uncharacterized repeat protein (TIGR03803 family)